MFILYPTRCLFLLLFLGGGSLPRSPSRARARAQMVCMSSGPLPECALRVGARGRPGPAASRCHGSPDGLDEDQRPQSASRRARVCMRRLACASAPDHTHALWWNCYHLHIRLLKSVQKRSSSPCPDVSFLPSHTRCSTSGALRRQQPGLSAARGAAGKGGWGAQGEFHFRTNVRGHTETVASGFYLRARPTSIPAEFDGPQSGIVFWSERPLKPKDQQFADIKQTKATAHLWLEGSIGRARG